MFQVWPCQGYNFRQKMFKVKYEISTPVTCEVVPKTANLARNKKILTLTINLKNGQNGYLHS